MIRNTKGKGMLCSCVGTRSFMVQTYLIDSIIRDHPQIMSRMGEGGGNGIKHEEPLFWLKNSIDFDVTEGKG